MRKRILVLAAVIFVCVGAVTFGSDQISVFASQADKIQEFGEGSFRAYTIQGNPALYMHGDLPGFIGESNTGLLEHADEALSQRNVTGDTIIGAKYASEWSQAGFRFRAGVNATLESYRLSGSNRYIDNLALGVGAIGGVEYYLTDSVALFMHMQAGYSPFTFGPGGDEQSPQRANSVLFQGGMSY